MLRYTASIIRPRLIGSFALPLLALFVAATAACSSSDPTPTPIPSPTPSPTPSIILLDIDARLSTNAVETGSAFAVSATSGSSGLAQYTLTIEDHLRSIVRYDGQLVDETSDGTFTVVSWDASATDAMWAIKANTPGHFTVNLFVSGEVGVTPTGPWFFTSGSESLPLDVS